MSYSINEGFITLLGVIDVNLEGTVNNAPDNMTVFVTGPISDLPYGGYQRGFITTYSKNGYKVQEYREASLAQYKGNKYIRAYNAEGWTEWKQL